MILLPQKLIFLTGENRRIEIQGEARQLSVIRCPSNLTVVTPPAQTAGGWMLEFRAGEREADKYGAIELRIETTAGEFQAEILSRVLSRREFFFCVVTTCNTHWGFDPSLTHLGDVPGSPRPSEILYSGDPLLFHGHAYASSRHMSEAAHQYQIPMTWLIDHTVAKEHGRELIEFHQQFGDDVGVLPSSYFHHNPVNYNQDRTLDEAVAVLQGTMDGIQRGLSRQNWAPEIKVGGVDQWVGALGSQWIEAARKVGLRALWGTAFDHVTCDSSMYHEGCPWDVYRLNKENFRYPSPRASDPWGFPWTTRDLVNSFHEYPGSSVFYSTDPDDIRGCGIMDNQPDYWDRMLEGLLENRKHNDMTCFVLHNEDHDAHRVWSQNYLLQFFSRLPASLVRATLDEVTQWLDLCYPENQHPRQALELEDPLRCHDAVAAKRSRGGFKPHAKWKTKNGLNPDVICYYDHRARWMASEGSPIPEQLIDYTTTGGFTETGVSPKVTLPKITSWKSEIIPDDSESYLEVEFESDRSLPHFPLIFWGKTRPRGAFHLKNAAFVWCNIKAGKNSFRWPAE